MTFLALGGAGACGQRSLTVVSPLRIGLIGLWHMDELTGTAVSDDSGIVPANNGTLAALDQTAWVEGKFGGALETKSAVDAKSTSYVTVARSSTTDAITDAITIAAWVYLDGTISDYATVLSRQISQIGFTLSQHYHLSLNSTGRPAAFIITSSPASDTTVILGPTAVTPRIWTHLAVTYDGTTATLYKDGVVVMSVPRSGAFEADTTPIILGGNTNGTTVTEPFRGRIDEIVLYNRALSAAEIGQLVAGTPF